MCDLVQLVLAVALAMLTALLLLRRDVIWLLFRRRKVVKVWEDVLGQRVIFSQDRQGGWSWDCMDLDITADPDVRFASQTACRLACAGMIYCFFVMEEVTSHPALPSTSGGGGAGAMSLPPFLSPPQGGGGG